MKVSIQKKFVIILILCMVLQTLNTSIVEANHIVTYEYSEEHTDETNEGTTRKKTNTEKTLAYANEKAKILTNLYGLTSLQYAIIDDGDMVVSGQAGYRNKMKKTPPKSTTMYGIASISKLYVTVAVLQLVEQGLIDLDTPIVNYIKEFTMADERYKNITVRMLLNHSSGLMGTTEVNAFTLGDNDHSTYENFLELIRSQRLKSNPGEIAVYCNDGFTLAEILVEKVSGIPYSTFIARYIRMPLELNHTHTSWERFQKSSLAKVYNLKNNVLPYEGLHMYGAAGLYSTAEEVCRFAQIFMKESNTTEILSTDMVQLMSQEEGTSGIWFDETTTSVDYGLGWDHVNVYPFSEYGIKALSKAGDLSYYHGNLIVLPEYNMAVCVLSVGGSSGINEYYGRELLLNYMEENEIIEKKMELPTAIDYKKANMPKEYEGYSGVYGNYTFQYTVEVEDNKLKLSTAGALGATEYRYSKKDWFVSKSGKEAYRFVTEENGETYLVYQGYPNVIGLGTSYSCFYLAQKLTDNPITEELSSIWEGRSEKVYFAISEKESSIYYDRMIPYYQLTMLEDMEGYTNLGKIVDETTLIQDYQIPMIYGRDLNDSVFFEEDEIEYVLFNHMVFIEEAAINKLPVSKVFYNTIEENGYGTYYEVGKKADGKRITITVPTNGSFLLYNKNYMLETSYYVDKETTITLTKGDYLLFLGEPGDRFTINYEKK